jgi:hypothetical protein
VGRVHNLDQGWHTDVFVEDEEVEEEEEEEEVDARPSSILTGGSCLDIGAAKTRRGTGILFHLRDFLCCFKEFGEPLLIMLMKKC